jgi:hypothetical protein
LTRSLDYQYSFASARAFAANVAVLQENALLRQKAMADLLKESTLPTVPGGTDVTPVKPSPSAEATPIAARDQVLKAMLDGLQKDLEAMRSSNVPGGAFAFASYDQNGITLTETFVRPLTFAYNGVSCAASPDNVSCAQVLDEAPPLQHQLY